MSYLPNQGLVSTINSTGGTITAGSSWTGAWEDISAFAAMSVIGSASTVATLYYDFSSNGVVQDRNVQLSDGTNGSLGIHGLTPVTKYGRARVVAGTGSSVTFTVQTLMSVSGRISQPTSRLSQSISDYSDVINSRSVAVAQTPDGTYTNTKQDGLGFSTTSLLTSGQTYSSGVLSLIGYTQVQTDLLSVGANGTTTIRFYEDAAGTNLLRTLTSTYTSGDGFKLLSAPAFTPYVKYDFTCTSTGQTQFYFDTKFTTKSISGQIINLTDNIAGGMVANLGRNIIAGRNDAGGFNNVNTDTLSNLKVSIQNPTTAFGEIQISEMTPVIQVTFPYNINPRLVSTSTVNSATITQADNMVSLSTSTTPASIGILETLAVAKYRAGQGIVGRFTALFTSGATTSDSFQVIGLGDAGNGYFFGYSGSTFGIHHRINSGITFISQSEWNNDKMDGSSNTTNPSGILLNPTKGNVFQIQYQWLGFGSVVFYIESSLTGKYVPVHQLRYANSNTIPSSYNPTFPIRAAVNNGTSTDVLTMKSASMSAFVEGKNEITGPTQSVFSNVSAGGTDTTVLLLDNVSVFPSGSTKTNKVVAYLKTISVATDANQSNDIVRIQIIENPTWAGQTYTYISGQESVVRYATNGTYTPSSGKVLGEVTTVGIQGKEIDLTNQKIALRPGKMIGFVTQGDAVNTNGINFTVSWVEDF